MAWSQIMGYVASKNVKEIEDDYCKSDYVVDMMTETFVIHVGDGDSESNDDESSSDGSDNDEMATTSINTTSSSEFHTNKLSLLVRTRRGLVALECKGQRGRATVQFKSRQASDLDGRLRIRVALPRHR
ncbi:hypothetical protein EVAR_46235_1 [Eumeta japonica]|uniref:Uncharacterized protein n=1 Tax=Eumeta variegata TaxID=151549 RepID=A0A4C1XL08_EUMVA|nr:hypothetical protein EVAR_46235_1 [Eumeta japonica]